MSHQAGRPLGAPENPRWEKSSLEKTYQCQTDAHDEVWALRRKTENALDTVAIPYERLDQVNSDLANVDKEFQREFHEMQAAMEKSKRPNGLWRYICGSIT